MVTVTVMGSPGQPDMLTGTTVYTTSTGLAVVFVHASFAITLAGRPEPEDGSPAEAVNPFALIEVILYEEAATLPAAVARLNPKASSLHLVVFRDASTGSGLMVIVIV